MSSTAVVLHGGESRSGGTAQWERRDAHGRTNPLWDATVDLWEKLSPMNKVLLLVVFFLWVFIALTLPRAEIVLESQEEVNDPNLYTIPEEKDEHDGINVNQQTIVNDDGDAETNFTSANLMCHTTGIGCNASSGGGGMPAIGFEEGADEAYTGVPVPSTTIEFAGNANDLSTGDGLRDRNLCQAFSRDEALEYLCKRNFVDYATINFILSRERPWQCLRETREEFCPAWQKCVRNILVTHFSAAEDKRTFFEYFNPSLTKDRFLRANPSLGFECTKLSIERRQARLRDQAQA